MLTLVRVVAAVDNALWPAVAASLGGGRTEPSPGVTGRPNPADADDEDEDGGGGGLVGATAGCT